MHSACKLANHDSIKKRAPAPRVAAASARMAQRWCGVYPCGDTFLVDGRPTPLPCLRCRTSVWPSAQKLHEISGTFTCYAFAKLIAGSYSVYEWNEDARGDFALRMHAGSGRAFLRQAGGGTDLVRERDFNAAEWHRPDAPPTMVGTVGTVGQQSGQHSMLRLDGPGRLEGAELLAGTSRVVRVELLARQALQQARTQMDDPEGDVCYVDDGDLLLCDATTAEPAYFFLSRDDSARRKLRLAAAVVTLCLHWRRRAAARRAGCAPDELGVHRGTPMHDVDSLVCQPSDAATSGRHCSRVESLEQRLLGGGPVMN